MATYITKAVSASESTTTSTSLQDKVTLTFTAGEQEADAVYYIVAWAQVYNGTAGAKVNLHLVNSTDTVTYQDLEYAPALADTEKSGQLMIGIYTAASTPAEKVFKIQYSAVTGTAKIHKACIYVFKKGSDDAHNESTGKTDATGTYADKASVTFTPASQGFYWLLGCAEYFMDSGDRPYGRITVGGTLQAAAEIIDTPTADSRNSIGISWVKELAASSQTVAFGIRDTSTFTDVYNARIICMRLSDFPAYWYDDETTNDTTPATSFEAKTSITQTLAAVEHLAIACVPARSSNTSSVNIVVTMKVDSTAVVENLSRPRNTFGIECIDGMIALHGWTGSGSSTTIEAGWHFSSSASGNLDDNSLLVLQLEDSGNTGTAVGSIGTITGTAAGTVDISGAASSTIGAITGTAAGSVDIAGAASGSIGEITGTATGTTASAITGEASGSIGTIAGTATATVDITGSASGAIGTITGSATGAVEVAGSASASIGTIAGSASATIDIAGAASGSIGTIAGTAASTIAITGAASGSIGEITGTATASTDGGITGSAVGSIGAITGSASAAVNVAGIASGSIGAITGTASATIEIAGQASASIGTIVGPAAGAVDITGAASGSIGMITGSAAGTVLTPGALDLPAGAYAFRWTHGERSMRWTHGERGFDWTHGERSFRHVDG